MGEAELQTCMITMKQRSMCADIYPFMQPLHFIMSLIYFWFSFT